MSSIPDVPDNYKKAVDHAHRGLMKHARALKPILEELGCDNFDLENEKDGIRIEVYYTKRENCCFCGKPTEITNPHFKPGSRCVCPECAKKV